MTQMFAGVHLASGEFENLLPSRVLLGREVSGKAEVAVSRSRIEGHVRHMAEESHLHIIASRSTRHNLDTGHAHHLT